MSLALSFLLLVACVASVCGQGACPDGFKLFDASCYKYMNSEQNWMEAQKTCNSIGAFLVEIFDQATNDFIVGMARKHNHHVIWLGGNDLAKTGQWVWGNSGLPVSTFDDWAANQPDTGSSTEHCMELNIDRFNSHWNDDQCDHRQRFICQVYADEEFIG